MHRLMTKKLVAICGAALLAGTVAAPVTARADAVGDFYKGRTMRVIIGYAAGGGYDIYARTVTRYMPRHIPGTPSIVPQNMPGAGSVVATQFMMYKAPKDGSYLATLGQNLPLSQILEPEKSKYDASKLIWIGNVNEGNNVVTMWHTSGVKTWQDLRKREYIIGATGPGGTSVEYPRAMNNILGTKLKIIIGFSGGSRINLAMERGEVEGRGSNAWASLKAATPDYLKKKLVVIPVQMGLRKEPDLDAPLLMDLAPTEAGRQVLELISAGVRIGRPILTTPDVPADRVAALRAAFDATMKDPAFLQEARRMKLDLNPVPGVEVEKIVHKILSTPADIVALTRVAVSKGATFNCAAIVKDKKLCAKKKKKKKKKM